MVEGVRVEREAVLGANVVLTASTKILDVTESGYELEYLYLCPLNDLFVLKYKTLYLKMVSCRLFALFWKNRCPEIFKTLKLNM